MMQRIPTLTRIALFLLLTAMVLALTQFWSIPLKHILVGIAACLLYGGLFVTELALLVFIFAGVFAFYRNIQGRNDQRLSV